MVSPCARSGVSQSFHRLEESAESSPGCDALGGAKGLLEETSLETDALYPFVS